ncbi:hypothetical protein L484_006446 [Morus notabilis]|uniref:Uncharacterized protein n=1 Tax=Morus notabilis TaxID=981085 RepID=W9S5C6_9ROSA|nr:uncharacterized protein LOC21389876 [Morus notabilis]EXC26395.1 hypothetical protein L484_006446 [Morus notabilis]
MSKQPIILRHPSSNRRQPLLRPPPSSSYSSGGSSRRLAEVAGGTAAECAAVCCCCPCGLLNLLVLAVYKIPAGLCRRAMRKKRRRRKGVLPPPCRRHAGDESEIVQVHPVSVQNDVVSDASCSSNKEVEALEKEMWERFYSTGFWRSPSQREIEQPSLPTIS